MELNATIIHSPKEILPEISDEIKVTYSFLDEFMDVFKQIPTTAGIVFEKNIPIRGMRLELPSGLVAEFKILENYMDIVDNYIADDKFHDFYLCVGYMELLFPRWKEKLFADVCVKYGSDEVYFRPNLEMVLGNYEAFINTLEGIYTIVNISLLHPKIKEVFSKPKEVKYTLKRKSGQMNKKRIVKHVKIHRIEEGEIREAVKQSKKIGCPCWYVCGHWRNYKDGKKVFIQGYWKGIARYIKHNFDGGRERRL